MNHPASSPSGQERRRLPTLSIVVAGAAVFVALSGTAVAAKGLIRSGDIATGAVSSRTIQDGSVKPWDLSGRTRDWLEGPKGATGATGPAGAAGAKGDIGATGSAGTPGTPGADGILAPLSATAGLTVLATATPPTVVVSLTVPAGDYVVLAKTQLTHSGAGDSIDCVLKAGSTAIDQVAMKTLPALAAIPVSLQAVTTTSPTQLSVECDVSVANGSATSSSLIALPIG